MASLNQENDLFVGDNAPYIVSDASDYTIPIHAERRGLHHVLVEIRQDLIADKSGQRAWALRLARVLPRAYHLPAEWPQTLHLAPCSNLPG
jgi:predicted N-formylglutamate amidohydrolase